MPSCTADVSANRDICRDISRDVAHTARPVQQQDIIAKQEDIDLT